ncbi:hypothetical protein C8Q76DRAFT_743922 [Earliella scabrosa]|nr:hypothetical protein C8Q76DRAFT_743922 [Earliella scabrosa]
MDSTFDNVVGPLNAALGSRWLSRAHTTPVRGRESGALSLYVVVLALIACVNGASGLEIRVAPEPPRQCIDVVVLALRGEPPFAYTVILLQGGRRISKLIGMTDDVSVSWPADVPAGTEVQFEVEQTDGIRVQSELYVVRATPDTSCIDDSDDFFPSSSTTTTILPQTPSVTTTASPPPPPSISSSADTPASPAVGDSDSSHLSTTTNSDTEQSTTRVTNHFPTGHLSDSVAHPPSLSPSDPSQLTSTAAPPPSTGSSATRLLGGTTPRLTSSGGPLSAPTDSITASPHTSNPLQKKLVAGLVAAGSVVLTVLLGVLWWRHRYRTQRLSGSRRGLSNDIDEKTRSSGPGAHSTDTAASPHETAELSNGTYHESLQATSIGKREREDRWGDTTILQRPLPALPSLSAEPGSIGGAFPSIPVPPAVNRVVYEMDGGIRLAGGPMDEDHDDEPRDQNGILTIALPPPYQRY